MNATRPARSRSSRKRASTSADVDVVEILVALLCVSSLAVCVQKSDGNEQSHAIVSTARPTPRAKSKLAQKSRATSYTPTWLDPLGSNPKLTRTNDPSALVFTDSIGASM